MLYEFLTNLMVNTLKLDLDNKNLIKISKIGEILLGKIFTAEFIRSLILAPGNDKTQ